ncbi:MAG: serine--tRNA ligase [Flavobacteriales bacterium]|nr:serine--tRNA ligase [Flavobacteriales bacterium]
MLEIHVLRENAPEIIEGLKKRNHDFTAPINEILELDEKRRACQQKMDQVLAESNALSRDIGDLFKRGKAEEANAMRAKSAEYKEESHRLKEEFQELDNRMNEALHHVPNVPNTIVPAGNSDKDNEVVHSEGETPNLGENNLPHWELADKYDLIDFDLGAKITGAGFPVYKGKGAKLQRALINFFLDEADKAGYNEVIPPHMVNEESGFGTGQLPDKEGQMYHATVDNLYLIPTAEVPVTNIFRDVILESKQFPIKMCAYTPCFRREAGSYGKDVRGLNRLHQFDKVEIVQIQHPDQSYDTLTTMVDHVKGLLQKLGLQFRILRLCGGDLGFTSALTYDMEVFSAAQERWLEVSSISNFETFQANRLKCRFRDENGKTRLVHTLNGSALALPRIVAALLENNQDADGIRIPECLHKYTGFERID